MKTIRLLYAAYLLPWAAIAAPFQNLNFDEPEIPDFAGLPIPGPSFEGTASVWMVPHWSVGNPVGYNHTQPFEGFSSLLDRNYRNTWQPANPVKAPVVGQFSLGIWPQSAPPGLAFQMGQTGDIPGDAQSLRFLYAGPGDFKVYVGGAERLVHFTESLPSGDPETASLDYYVVDVSPFAGQTVQLLFEFSSLGNYPNQEGGPYLGFPDAKFHVLDDLSFSPLPAVPEPQPWALLGTGLAAVSWLTRRK